MVRLTQGSPPVLLLGLLTTTANRLDEEIPKRGGAEGGRSTDSTHDSGPMKPGNSVEEHTLTIRPNGSTDEKKSRSAAVWLSRTRSRDRGSRGRKGTVIAPRSRHSGAWKDPKSRGGGRISEEIPGCRGIRGSRHPVQVMRPHAARQALVCKMITENVW